MYSRLCGGDSSVNCTSKTCSFFFCSNNRTVEFSRFHPMILWGTAWIKQSHEKRHTGILSHTCKPSVDVKCVLISPATSSRIKRGKFPLISSHATHTVQRQRAVNIIQSSVDITGHTQWAGSVGAAQKCRGNSHSSQRLRAGWLEGAGGAAPLDTVVLLQHEAGGAAGL